MKTLKLKKLVVSMTLAITAEVFLLTGTTFAALPASGVVDNSNHAGEQNSIAVDSNGYPHISYYQGWDGELRYAYWDGSQWNIEIVEGLDSWHDHPSIAVDNSRNPHIVYVRLNDTCRYAVKSAGIWSNVNIVLKETGGGTDECDDHVAIALGSDDSLHICAVGYWSAAVFYSSDGSTAYEIPGTGNWAANVSICVDQYGNPHISYRDVFSDKVYYAHNDGTPVWTVEKVSSIETGWFADDETRIPIAVDEDDIVHIAFYTASGKLCHAYKHITSSTWNTEYVPDTSTDYGRCPSIAIDNLNRIHMTYRDKANQKVKWAFKTHEDSDWNIQEVYSDPFNYSSSLAIKGDRIYFSYYDDGLWFYTTTVSSLPPKLSVNPPSHDFGDSGVTLTITVTNTGGGTLNWNANENLDWLGLNTDAGSLSAGSSENVTATVDRTGKAPGTYNGTISFTSNGGNQNVIVSMTVSGLDPVLSVSPPSHDFGDSGVTLTITVTNTGGGTLNWNANENLDWLGLNTDAGSLSAGSSENVTATVDRTGKAPGTYNGTISFTSSYGSQDVSVSMTVLDTIPPEISNLTVNPAIAKAGTNLTITFTVSEALQGNPSVTVAGNAATFNSKSGNNYTYTYTVQGIEGEGNKTVNVLATDLAGNPGSAFTTVTFDFTAPTISNLTVNPAIAKAGTNLTITFTVNEALQGNPAVTVGGNAATFYGKSGNSYTYTYTAQGTEGEGNKTVNVSATDSAGNTGSGNTAVTFDFTAPTIFPLAVDPTIAKSGTNLTITFTVSEALPGNPMVTVAGNAATFYGKSGNSYTYTYTVQGTEGEGSKTVNVSATDSAGNPGSASTAVTFDFTAPTISNLTVNPTIAKAGVNLTIAFTVSEALESNPLVTVEGNVATFNSKSGNNYTYTYTVQGTEGEGNKPVNVLATDLAGNPGSAFTTVTFDFTAPTCEADNWGIWHAEDITITLTSTDVVSGIAIARYNWDTPASETVGTEYSDGDTIILDQETGTDGKTLYLYAKDNVGNENTWNGTYYLDKTGPICSADNSEIWHIEDITIKLSYSASTGDITIAKYNWDTPASETTGTDYSNGETISLTTETDGKTLYLYVKDDVGREKTWSGTYKLDKTDPSCSADNSGIWHTENITITLSESDSISGIATARYNWDTPASATAGIEYSDGNTITLTTETGPEDKILYLYVKDNAGREKTWNGTYYLDKTPPSNCSISINNGDGQTNSTSVILNLWAEDSGSGVSGMRFSTDTVHYSELKDYATYYAFTLPEGDGEKTVYAKFKDGAGNWSDPVSDTIILDTQKPTVELVVDNDKSTILPDGEIVGVLPDTGMEAKFSKVMISSSVEQGLKLIAVKDNLNNSINEEVSLNFAWEGSTKTVITPVSELKKNHLYSLKVTDKVKDLAGNTVKGNREIIFRTIMDHTEKNVIVKATNEKLMVTLEANALTVTLEANALTEDGYLIINTEPLTYQFKVNPEDINVANEKSITNRWYPIEGCLWEIKVCKENGDWLEDKFAYEVKITFPYDEDRGEVGNAPISLKEETLQAFWLNEEHCNWVRVPGSRVDREKNVVVTGEVSHFSVFALMGSAVYDLSDAHAYPVPWKPNDGKKETGNEKGITFTNLSTQGVIKIYTISGELIREYDYKSADGEWTWDVKTSSGEKVFSGVYIYSIKNEKEHKTGKLMIIR